MAWVVREGLSTDTKPTDASVLAGEYFRELDTGQLYRYDATLGAWLLQSEPLGFGATSTDASPDDTRKLLRRLMRTLELQGTELPPDLVEEAAEAETELIDGA